jgi:hypothetical protein
VSVVINEFEVVPAQQPQQGTQAQAQPVPAPPPSPGEIDEEIRRALRRLENRERRLRAT